MLWCCPSTSLWSKKEWTEVLQRAQVGLVLAQVRVQLPVLAEEPVSS
jgi:hypothetical protein